jgi:hypothetical protein
MNLLWLPDLNPIQCGMYDEREGDRIDWKLVSMTELTKISPYCKWNVKWCAISARTQVPLEEVNATSFILPNKYRSVHSVLLPDRDRSLYSLLPPNMRQGPQDVCVAFGQALIFQEVWDAKGNDTCTIEVCKYERKEDTKVVESTTT